MKQNNRMDNYELSWYLGAFLDVLGQGEKLRELRKLPTNETEREETQKVLKETAGHILRQRELLEIYFEQYREPSSIFGSLPPNVQEKIHSARKAAQYRYFSDSIIMMVNLKNEDEHFTPMNAVHGNIAACSYLLLLSLVDGKPIRGGLDVGLGITITPDEVYGPVLARAYCLESKVAKSPRIVVGDELWDYLNVVEKQKPHSLLGQMAVGLATVTKKYITTDSDGLRILDFLGKQITNLLPKDERRQLFIRAENYVMEQHACWKDRKHEGLEEGYGRLREYFVARRGLWQY